MKTSVKKLRDIGKGKVPGVGKRCDKVHFDVEIGSVSAFPKDNVILFVQWKRGRGKGGVTRRAFVNKGEARFDELLHLPCNVQILDDEDRSSGVEYAPKLLYLGMNRVDNSAKKGHRLVGKVVVNLADFCKIETVQDRQYPCHMATGSGSLVSVRIGRRRAPHIPSIAALGRTYTEAVDERSHKANQLQSGSQSWEETTDTISVDDDDDDDLGISNTAIEDIGEILEKNQESQTNEDAMLRINDPDNSADSLSMSTTTEEKEKEKDKEKHKKSNSVDIVGSPGAEAPENTPSSSRRKHRSEKNSEDREKDREKDRRSRRHHHHRAASTGVGGASSSKSSKKDSSGNGDHLATTTQSATASSATTKSASQPTSDNPNLPMSVNIPKRGAGSGRNSTMTKSLSSIGSPSTSSPFSMGVEGEKELSGHPRPRRQAWNGSISSGFGDGFGDGLLDNEEDEDEDEEVENTEGGEAEKESAPKDEQRINTNTSPSPNPDLEAPTPPTRGAHRPRVRFAEPGSGGGGIDSESKTTTTTTSPPDNSSSSSSHQNTHPDSKLAFFRKKTLSSRPTGLALLEGGMAGSDLEGADALVIEALHSSVDGLRSVLNRLEWREYISNICLSISLSPSLELLSGLGNIPWAAAVIVKVLDNAHVVGGSSVNVDLNCILLLSSLLSSIDSAIISSSSSPEMLAYWFSVTSAIPALISTTESFPPHSPPPALPSEWAEPPGSDPCDGRGGYVPGFTSLQHSMMSDRGGTGLCERLEQYCVWGFRLLAHAASNQLVSELGRVCDAILGESCLFHDSNLRTSAGLVRDNSQLAISIVGTLSRLVSVCKKAGTLPELLESAVFALLSRLDSSLFNSFVGNDVIATTNSALSVKYFLSSVDGWMVDTFPVPQATALRSAVCFTRQAADVLLTRKDMLTSPVHREVVCPSLSMNQLLAICRRFAADKSSNEDTVPASVTKTLRSMATRERESTPFAADVRKSSKWIHLPNGIPMPDGMSWDATCASVELPVLIKRHPRYKALAATSKRKT